jgi:hypothetical protein
MLRQELVADLRGGLGIPFLAAIALQPAVPLSLFSRVPRQLSSLGALIIVGAALVVLARRELAQHGQPTDPGLPTSKVVTTGVFSVSRNPLYLGGVGVLVGIALVVNLPWVLVLLLPALVACHYVLIAPEERYPLSSSVRNTLCTPSVHRWQRARDSSGEIDFVKPQANRGRLWFSFVPNGTAPG